MGGLMYSVEVNRARMDALLAQAGDAPRLEFWALQSGESAPVTCHSMPTGVLVAAGVCTLPMPPVEWLGGYSGEHEAEFVQRANTGAPWPQFVVALLAPGRISYARVVSSGGTCVLQAPCADWTELPQVQPAVRDPVTGVYTITPSADRQTIYVDGITITQAQVDAGMQIVVAGLTLTAGCQASWVDIDLHM